MARTRSSPQAAWAAMVREIRNLGRPGITSMAIAAVDTRAVGPQGAAARPAAVQAARDGPRPRAGLRLGRLHLVFARPPRGAARRLGAAGHSAGEDEGRLRRRSMIRSGSRSAREAIGPRHGAVRRRQRRLLRASRRWRWPSASRAEAGVSWFEEPVSSDDLEGCACCAIARRPGWQIAAGEYGYDAALLPSGCSTRGRSTCSRPTSPGARGSPSCCASTRCAARAAMPLSLHCGPSIHLHPGSRSSSSSTSSTSTTTSGSSSCCSTASSARATERSAPTSAVPGSGSSSSARMRSAMRA